MKRILLVTITALFLTACSNPTNSSVQYDEVKKIMTDLIQTEEGKKALRQVFEEASFRELLVLESSEVKKSIEETLLSKEAETFWKTSLEDPKFKETLAKSMQKELTTIQKDLLKDPTYQEDLIKFFGQPEMQKQFETLLKSKEMRKEMEKVVKETIESPLMQNKWIELIRKSGEAENDKKAAEEKKNE